jgi:CheY-like chemotaxis protein
LTADIGARCTREDGDAVAIVVIDGGSFCHGETVADALRERLGLDRLEDDALFASAQERFGVEPKRLERLMYGSRTLLDRARRDEAKLAAYLRAAVAEAVRHNGRLYLGGAGHLVPPSLTHVLKVCLGGTHEWRTEQAVGSGLSRRQAQSRISSDDEARADWTGFLFDRGPWDKSLYDVFLPMQETSVEQAVSTVSELATAPAVAFTPSVEMAVRDFGLAAEVGVAVAEAGHDVDVTCTDGRIGVLIKHHTMFLERLMRELEEIATAVDGVRSVAARPGPRYREPSISFDLDMEVPSKVLLVDDEQEFVHTLSERLQSRRMQPAIAYDGEQALAMVESEEPEVMVLDLKMPGIDGLEVLRRVKRTHPATEVIILTGHGSDAEEVLAYDLGAFAYLRKPVDIEELTRTMKAAYQQIERSRGERDGATEG